MSFDGLYLLYSNASPACKLFTKLIVNQKVFNEHIHPICIDNNDVLRLIKHTIKVVPSLMIYKDSPTGKEIAVLDGENMYKWFDEYMPNILNTTIFENNQSNPNIFNQSNQSNRQSNPSNPSNLQKSNLAQVNKARQPPVLTEEPVNNHTVKSSNHENIHGGVSGVQGVQGVQGVGGTNAEKYAIASSKESDIPENKYDRPENKPDEKDEKSNSTNQSNNQIENLDNVPDMPNSGTEPVKAGNSTQNKKKQTIDQKLKEMEMERDAMAREEEKNKHSK